MRAEAGEKSDDPSQHPLVLAVEHLLAAVHNGEGNKVRVCLEDLVPLAHGAASCGVQGDHDAAAKQQEDLRVGLREAEEATAPLQPELRAVWAVLVADKQTEQAPVLSEEEAEELVLAHLYVYPDVLSQKLVGALIQQLALGQSLLDAGERRLGVDRLMQHLGPRLPAHSEAAARVARACCEKLSHRSEQLAAALLRRLSTGGGSVDETVFLQRALHALALELENVALSAGVQVLLADESFANDVHTAAAAAMFGFDMPRGS